MRLVQCVAVALPVTLVIIQPGPAQEAQAIDRTDPVAVAEAYLKACQEGDFDTVSALTVLDDATREGARETWDSLRSSMWVAQSLLAALATTPMKLPIQSELIDTKREAGKVELTYRGSYRFEHKLVLTRAADGTWGVDVLASAADLPDLEDATALPGGEGPWPPGPELDPWKSRERLSALYMAFEEYAEEHQKRLPAAARWVDGLEAYVLDPALFRSPASEDLEYGYAMNVEAGGHEIGDFAADHDLLLLIEWPGGERNAVVSPDAVSQIQSLRPDGITVFMDAAGFADELPQGHTLAGIREAEASESQCRQNLRLLARAARRYAREHDGLLPPADSWQDDLALYLVNMGQGEEVFTCPAAAGLACGYAINAEVAGKKVADLTGHDSIILFFESDLNVANAAGSPEQDACAGPRHLSSPDWLPTSNIVYLSGETGSTWAPEPADE